MKKQKLFLISVVMTLSLLGLLSVQFYWTRRIFAIGEDFINHSAHAAMEEVVAVLDKDVSSARWLRVQNLRRLDFELDSVDAVIGSLRYSYPQVLHETCGLVWNEDGGYTLVHKRLKSMKWSDTVNGVVLTGSFMQAEGDLPARLPDTLARQIETAYRNLLQRRDDLMYARRMLNEMMRSSLSQAPEREVGAQIAPKVLDSMISSALVAHNLNTTCEWGVYSSYSSKLLLQKTGRYGVELLQSPLIYRLFPSQPTDYPTFLLLYFPNRLAFIFAQMWYLVVASVVLFVLLIYIFVYTVVSIWRQKKLTEMKSDFINHVTHEIKTPVSTIALVCESLDDPDMHYDQEGLKELFRIIRNENQRLQSLSGQIIQISRMEKGDYFLNKTEFPLHKAIEEAVNNTGFQVMHKNGSIVTHLEAHNDLVTGDRTHIVHIISNLIDNANKYCTEKPLIEITTQNVEGGIRVDVKDNGIGIAKANQKKIFDKLYRVPTGNLHDVKGFGLGLSYVASIMKQHGGRVWLESEPKEGSVFHLFFVQEKG
ncbi:MAG: HAMP domain-containing histidine kinase [Bacteroides sp.]|nr:HAMP domain-containing histidine kinase [Ruminococcus flavefaciens]MCM1554816.1 HAMP domain-containing histidine kinase [Bacteroides sp.]